MRRRLMRAIAALVASTALLLSACESGTESGSSALHDALATAQAHGASENGTPAHATGGPDSVTGRIEPGALAMVAAEPAMGWSGPGGAPFEVARRTADPRSPHARRFGTVTMPIALRDERRTVAQFPCGSCHLGRAMSLRDDRVADAHENIATPHPSETGGVCGTCHAPDNVELLVLKRGERATLDHAYRLCAQCHVRQVEAWANGAHGKRLDGWQGRRVVMGCADCHDPHQPALESRIPFRAPRLERAGGHD